MRVATLVWEYDSALCLLSDRGFSQPIESGEHMAISFNLCATAFVDYVFTNPRTLVQGKASPEFIERTAASGERLSEKRIHVGFESNNLDMLARYNRHVVEQCHKRVFCSVKTDLVLSEPGF
jgi:hypothetical protein